MLMIITKNIILDFNKKENTFFEKNYYFFRHKKSKIITNFLRKMIKHEQIKDNR